MVITLYSFSKKRNSTRRPSGGLDVEVKFNLRGRTLTAVRGASLDLYEGETLAIVGESGCGKSVFTKSFIGMLDKNGSVTGGQILYRTGETDEKGEPVYEDFTKYTTEVSSYAPVTETQATEPTAPAAIPADTLPAGGVG